MKTIFDTTTLRATTLRNRVWRSATWLGQAEADGQVSDPISHTYQALAEGGASLLVTGLTSISANDAIIGGECKFFDDTFIPGHRRLTDAVHRRGAAILMQTAMVDGPVDELSTAQVDAVVRSFAATAHRAELAGYDGVQIHAAHFFYLSKFISPLFNHRTDRYAGSAILPAILAAMRACTSPNFLVTMKINSTDEYPGGLDLPLFLDVCRSMQGLDAIEVSANGTSRRGIRAYANEGSFLPAAARLADEVDTPVALVGGVRSMEFANRVLNETRIAYISLSRPLICEPGLIRRWQRGDTAPSLCVSCNGCYSSPGHRCIVHPRPRG